MVSGIGDIIKPYNRETDIEKWISNVENAIIAVIGEGVSENRKIAMLVTFIGDEGKTVIENMTEAEKDTYTHLKEALKQHYADAINITVERHRFHMFRQDEGEPIDQFITRLKTQAAKCNFVVSHKFTAGTQENPVQREVITDISDQFIRDRLVCGIHDHPSRAKLLREKELTLQSAVEILKAVETANNHVKKMFNRTNTELSVDGVKNWRNSNDKKERNFTKPQLKPSTSKDSARNSNDCGRCGGPKHTRAQCPAIKAECHVCKRIGHYGKKCRNKNLHEFQRHEFQQHERPPDQHDEALFMGILRCDAICDIDCVDWIEQTELDNVLIPVKVDTGAQANVLPLTLFRKHFEKGQMMSESRVKLTGYGGTNIPISGEVNLKCKINGISVNSKFIVVPLNVKPVLGLHTSYQLGLVKPKQSASAVCENSEVCRVSTSENRESKVDYVTNTFRYDELCKEFKDVFSAKEVGLINQPYDIKLKENVTPAVHAPRKTPFTLTDKVVKELKRMEDLNVLKKVDEATEWVNSMTVTEKPGGKIRICIDPTDLNRAIIREHSPLPTDEEIMTRLGGSKIFSKLDARDGYWQVPLTEKSSYLTTFNTLMGRYRYLRLPFGLISANEVFQKRMTQEYERLEGVEVVYDDILVHGSTQEEHDERLKAALQCTREAGIKLNGAKCKFGLPEVTYLGRVISGEGVKPDPEKIKDILDMPKPTDKAGVQRILGMINFLAKFIPNMSAITQPLRILLIKDAEFTWTQQQDKTLSEIKKILTSEPVLGFYDAKKEVKLLCDASQYGLGTCLMQDGKPIAYASRSLTPTQVRYAQIEKELLAIVFGCERFHQYVYGKDIEVHTDHKPLLNIVNKMNIGQAPPRIQRLLLRLLRYTVELKFIPGKLLFIPDTLSRAFVCRPPSESDVILQNEAELMVHSFIANLNCTDEFKSKLRVEIENDPILCYVKQYVMTGWPGALKDCFEPAKAYFNLRDNLFVVDDILLFGSRVVIPRKLRAELLERIHLGHQGQTRCKSLARKSVYWLHMNQDIDEMVRRCETCLTRRSLPKKEPLQPDNVPDRPWQRISVDKLYVKGREYQIITDYFSKFVELEILPRNPNSKNCIDHIKRTVSRFGLPEIIRSDGDPLYTSREFKEFVRSYEIKHVISSARYAQSNGFIERHVATMKNMLLKCEDINLALLNYRNTPISDELPSPAKILFGRELRTKVPTCSDLLITENDRRVKVVLEKRTNKMEYYYNQHASDRDDFIPGQVVRYKDGFSDKIWKKGQIIGPRYDTDTGRSYNVLSQNGNQILRNKRFLISDNQPQQRMTVIPESSPHSTTTYITPVVPVPSSTMCNETETQDMTMSVSEPSSPDSNERRPPSDEPSHTLPLRARSSRIRKPATVCNLPCCK